ncbi:GGDEF domain-containing protein [Methylobacterium sp. WL30]|nr:GGDEF domain-containing protein [Methylobacterium sp. WL93]TXN50637.1 GGDEF domain-containing protein [Methylobacterium sp. WL119]TXN68252.1 GGDEF domain-containing protein [Methylobacterium sp. WL30]
MPYQPVWSQYVSIGRKNRIESIAVRNALVADLAYSTVPTSIMGCTIVGIAVFAYVSTELVILLPAAACGALGAIGKLGLMQCQRKFAKRNDLQTSEPMDWELWHAALTMLMAVSVGIIAASIFFQDDVKLQMLATGLMFGYCSGVVSRLGIRPKIAMAALISSAGPTLISASLWCDSPHLILAAIFLMFLLGGFESVRHVYQTAVRHFSMRLEMAMLAQKDPLTGLANRIGLRTAFQAISPDDAVAVFCLDLDGFKLVNDRYGHAMGDALLKLVAERLVAATRPDATTVRMGGDEFVVLQPGMHRHSEVEGLARGITTYLQEPFRLVGEDVRIGASVGHAVSALKPTDLDGLLMRADEASYRIKSSRKPGMPSRRSLYVIQGGA